MAIYDVNSISKLKSFVTLWAVFLAVVKAEIRCYCNQPSCVATGYMCKSNFGSCFTEMFSYSTDLSKSRHGCVELLSSNKRTQCRSTTAAIESLPAVICCREDMCNYMTPKDIRLHPNHTEVTGSFDLAKERHAYEAAMQQEIWFKAAVIAVPIAGGFILVLLILLASRMLRQDSKRQRQLLELRHHQQQQRLCGSKPQFLIAQPCLSHPNCHTVPQNSMKSSHAYGNACIACDNWCVDERQCVEEEARQTRNSICASLLPWAKVHKQKILVHI